MTTKVEFAIVGGGPVGTILGYDLARRGLAGVIIDRSENSLLRKAGSCNVRTMEHLRRIGLAETVDSAFSRLPGHHLDIVFSTGLSGYELHRFKGALGASPSDTSPEVTQIIPQRSLQVAVRRLIESKYQQVKFVDNATVKTLNEASDIVKISYVNAEGRSHTISTTYAIGCDGGSSIVRKHIGSTLLGKGGTDRNLRITFSSPALYELAELRPAQQFWIVSDKIKGSFNWGRGYNDNELFSLTLLKADADMERKVRSNPKAVVFAAAGFEFPLEIFSIDEWQTHDLVADKWRSSRIFIAGDAAHLHPPTGGFGLNTGIADALDLSWKLAAVFAGWGGETLLDSYEAERRPAAARVVRQSNRNYERAAPANFYTAGLDQPGVENDKLRMTAKQAILGLSEEFHSPGIVLGTVYRNSPIIVSDESELETETVTTYIPSARPGSRLPHAWLSKGISLFSKLGDGLSLIVVGDIAKSEINLAKTAAAELSIPLNVISLDKDYIDLYQAPLLIVRPDQHIAWRSSSVPASWRDLLKIVTGS